MNLMQALLTALINGPGGSGDVTPASIVTATRQMTDDQKAQTRQNIGADTPETVAEWLSEHVDPETGYVIDDTLTIQGAAADAKAVGDKISGLSGDLTEIKDVLNIVDNISVNDTVTGSVIMVPDVNLAIGDVVKMTLAAAVDNSVFLKIFLSDDTQYTSQKLGAGGTEKTYTIVETLNHAKIGVQTNYPSADITIEVTPAVKPQNEIDKINADIEDIKDSIGNLDTAFLLSKNLVNPETISADKYVDQTNGKIKDGSGHKCTDYIPVKPNTAYCFNNSNNQTNVYCRFAFYNESKTYISGDAGNIDSKFGCTVTSPANAAYMVYSDATTSIPMIAEGNNKPAFEEYGKYYVDPQYVLEANGDLVVNLPKDIYALVGFELNIYFENITEDWAKYKWNVDCPVGKQMERGYSITPAAADAGDHLLIITVYQSPEIAISYRATLHVIATSANDGVTKDIIVLGDSTTYDGTVISKIHENLTGDVMQINTLGTMGTAPNNHEGRSGWSFATYFTKESVTYPSPDPRGTIYNPFYNPSTQTFDASYYFANNRGVPIPDWFFINMGINDTFDFKNDVQIRSGIDTVIDYYDAAIASLKEAAPNMNIGICLTIPPNHSQDAFGKAYDCNQNRDQYKRNNTLFVQRLIAEYGGREDEGIYLVPIHTNLDTIYNMGMESLPVNGRNTSVTYQSPIGNGGVHPASSGYWQIADVYTAFLKGTL